MTCGGMLGRSRGGHLGSRIVPHDSLALEVNRIQGEKISFDLVPGTHPTAPDRLNGSENSSLNIAPVSQTPQAPQTHHSFVGFSFERKSKRVRVSFPPSVLVLSSSLQEEEAQEHPTNLHLMLDDRVSDVLRASPSSPANSDQEMSALEETDEEGSDKVEFDKEDLDDTMTFDQVQLGMRSEALVRKNS